MYAHARFPRRGMKQARNPSWTAPHSGTLRGEDEIPTEYRRGRVEPAKTEPGADETTARTPSAPFDTVFEPAYGTAVPVAPNVRRVTGRNPSAFTFFGTNAYVIGTESCFVVDPGPDLDEHLAAILDAVAGRPVEAILLTHTHRDHTGLVRRLAERTGAPILGEGPHRASRAAFAGEDIRLDASGDVDLVLDRRIADGETLRLGGIDVTTIATPGHCVNHLAFQLGGDGLVLSGDHVMVWSTSIVAPPDGAMRDYMASLDRMLARDDRLYLPGHGGPVTKPKPFVRALIAHRRMRERAIIECVSSGDDTIAHIVATVYRTTDRALHGAAGLSVLAHLEDLVERGIVTADGPPTLAARYALA